LAEGATHFAENAFERRQNRHLVRQPRVPERAQASLFSRERGL